MSRKKVTVEVGPNDQAVDLYDHVALKNVRYGQWRENNKNGRYLLPEHLGGSDYSGSLVQRSNFESFSEQFAAGEDEWWTNAVGGHGTYAILIDMKSVPENIETDVAEFLNALHDYPVADDELHSKLESEAQEEAWSNWARHDFIVALEGEHDVDLDGVGEDALLELFEKSREKANEYWINESGGEMYIDMKKILEKVSSKDVAELMKG